MTSEMTTLLPPNDGEDTPLLPPNDGEGGNEIHTDGRRDGGSAKNSRLCRRHSLWQAAPFLLVAAVVFLVTVNFLPTFHNGTTTLDDLNPANVTFRELSQQMLPEAYDEMCKALPLLQQLHLKPSQVHDTRKIILRTRDLLDVFSPVYPIYQHQENETDYNDNDEYDLWLTLRKLTSKLYEKVGEFQDLHYAKHRSHHIKHHRRKKVQQLVANFSQEEVIRDSQMCHYLAAPTNGCYPRKESHLFWPNTARLPAGRDAAMPNLRSLGIQQINHALEYLNETLSYDGLANDTIHATFHNLRKEMKSLTDEYDLFVNSSGSMKYIMFPPAASEPTGIPLLKEAHIVLGMLNNDFVGLEIYTQNINESQPLEEDILRDRIREGWESVCAWVDQVQLEQRLKDLASLLETDDPFGQYSQ